MHPPERGDERAGAGVPRVLRERELGVIQCTTRKIRWESRAEHSVRAKGREGVLSFAWSNKKFKSCSVECAALGLIWCHPLPTPRLSLFSGAWPSPRFSSSNCLAENYIQNWRRLPVFVSPALAFALVSFFLPHSPLRIQDTPTLRACQLTHSLSVIDLLLGPSQRRLRRLGWM